MRRDKGGLNSIKESLRDLGEKAIAKGLLDHIWNSGKAMVTAATTTASAAMAMATEAEPSINILSLSGLLLAHIALKYRKDRDAQIVKNEFQKRHTEIQRYLSKDKETQLTELSKIIEIQLEQRKLYGNLFEFLKTEIHNQNRSINDICNKISFTRKEQRSFSERIIDKIDNLKTEIASLRQTVISNGEKTCSILKETKDEILSEFRSITSDLQAKPSNLDAARVLISFLNIVPEEHIITGLDDFFDTQVDIIADRISRYALEDALTMIDKISIDEKYADSKKADGWLSALRGYALLLGKQDRGLEALEHSKSLLKNETNSITLQVIYSYGHACKGENNKALEILKPLVENKGESSPTAVALWITLCESPVEDIEAQLTEIQKNHFKIIEALARKAMSQECYSKAEEYAKKGVQTSQNQNIHPFPAYAILAETLLLKKLGTITYVGFLKKHIDKKNWPDFIEIIRYYTLVLDKIESCTSSIFISQTIYNLIITHFTVGDYIEAESYIDKFSKLEKIDPVCLETILEILVKIGKLNKAISICQNREGKILKFPTLIFKYAHYLFSMGPEERKKAFSILYPVIKDGANKSKEPIFIESTILYGSELIKENAIEELDKLYNILDSTSNHLPLKLLQAIQEFSHENRDKCKINTLITDAMQLMNDIFPLEQRAFKREISSCRNNIILNMIPLLRECNNLNLCLILLDDIIPRDEVTDIGLLFINIAIEASDFNRTKKYCSDLRNNGCYDWSLVELEIQTSMRISHLETENLIKSFLNHPHLISYHKELNVYQAILMYGQGTLSALSPENNHLSTYPEVAEIKTTQLYPYINIPFLLKKIGLCQESLEYAYLLYKRFPNIKEIKQVFIGIMIPSLDIELPAPRKVTSDCVIIYEEKNTSNTHHIIIDDSPFNDENRNEYSSQHELSILLAGKAIGDEFILNGFGGNRVYKITDIKNKYVFHFQKFIEEETTRLTDSNVMLIKIKKDGNGNPDFSELIRQLSIQNEYQEKRIEKANDFYIQKCPSVYIFSFLSGLPLFECIIHFSRQESLYIHTAQGTENEMEQSYNILSNKGHIVLSPLTVEILIIMEFLYNFNICNILKNTQFKFYISEYLIDDLRIRQNEPISGKLLCLINEQPTIIENNMGKYKQTLQKIEQYLNTLNIVQGNLSENEFNLSGPNCKNFVTRSTYHSLQIASSENYILWEDDKNIVQLCNISPNDINVINRIFTQSILGFLLNAEHISRDIMATGNICLLSMNEYFTSFNADTIKKIFLDNKKLLFLQGRIFKYMQDKTTDINSIIFVTSVGIAEIWKESQDLKTLSLIFENLIKREREAAQLALGKILVLLRNTNIEHELLEKFLYNSYGLKAL